MKQQIKAMLEEKRGVSPVIGVILMVAITVILAAVIGTFVLGLGDSLQQAPQAQLDVVSEENNTVTINHNGGDPIRANEVTVNINDSEETLDEDLTVGNSVSFDNDSWGGDEVGVTIVHNPSESILLDTQVEVPDGS